MVKLDVTGELHILNQMMADDEPPPLLARFDGHPTVLCRFLVLQCETQTDLYAFTPLATRC